MGGGGRQEQGQQGLEASVDISNPQVSKPDCLYDRDKDRHAHLPPLQPEPPRIIVCPFRDFLDQLAAAAGAPVLPQCYVQQELPLAGVAPVADHVV